MKRILQLGCAVAAGFASAHVAPAVTGIRPVRRFLWPRLAGVGAGDHIALTFDGGPDPVATPRFLDVLDEYKVRATFFVLGSRLRRSPGLGREIAQAGHEVAVRGWEHRNLLFTGPGATYDDIARTRDLVIAVTGEIPEYFRPSYGILTTPALLAARRLGLTPVLWTYAAWDWTSHATPASVYRAAARESVQGGTLLLHDSDHASRPGCWRAGLAALPRLLEEYARRGYRVGPLREHVQAGESVPL